MNRARTSSLFTADDPSDYLFRRYRQGKRIGKEITLFSVWFELRWGIVSCLMLTVALITTVFYFHPSTTNVTSFFRTVPIISEKIGRVAEIYSGLSAHVEKGAPIFRLDSSQQQASRRAFASPDCRDRRRDVGRAVGCPGG